MGVGRRSLINYQADLGVNLKVLKTAIDPRFQHRSARLGAALAYYSVFLMGPLLLIMTSVAGMFFGADAVRGSLTGTHAKESLCSELLGLRPTLTVIVTSQGRWFVMMRGTRCIRNRFSKAPGLTPHDPLVRDAMRSKRHGQHHLPCWTDRCGHVHPQRPRPPLSSLNQRRSTQ